MPMYEVDYNYKIVEYDVIQIEAENLETAEEFALEQIKDTYKDISDVEIESVRELKR